MNGYRYMKTHTINDLILSLSARQFSHCAAQNVIDSFQFAYIIVLIPIRLAVVENNMIVIDAVEFYS